MATLPSGDIITITSESAKLASNKDISIVIKIKDRSASYNSSYTSRIVDLGNYEINFDLQEDSNNLTDFLYNTANFKFTMFTEMTDGTSFGGMLNALLATDLLQIEVTYDTYNKDTFLCLKNDVEYNELKRTFSVKCYSSFKYANQITAYSDSSYTIDMNYSSASLNFTGITTRDLISAYLKTIGSSGSTEKVASDFTVRRTDIESLGANTVTSHIYTTADTSNSLIDGTGSELVVNGFSDARSRVLRLGLAETAQIGTLFGVNFYIRRDYNSTTDATLYSNIDANDLETFNISFFGSSIKDISVNFGAVSANGTVTIDTSGVQSLDLLVGTIVNTVTLSNYLASPESVEVTNPNGGYLESTAGLDLVNNAIDAYKNIFGAGGATKFSGTILGIEKCLPYQFLQLSTGISDFVTSSNNKVRPSKLTYNLKQDKVNFEAYSIN